MVTWAKYKEWLATEADKREGSRDQIATIVAVPPMWDDLKKDPQFDVEYHPQVMAGTGVSGYLWGRDVVVHLNCPLGFHCEDKAWVAFPKHSREL